MNEDIDPGIRRLFPWALFLVLAIMFALGAMVVRAHAQEPDPNITCADVVKRVGLKPLWVAERQARKKYPDITEAQIAWGKQCVTDHRRAVVNGIVDEIKGAF
jgi:hypothetical protein